LGDACQLRDQYLINRSLFFDDGNRLTGLSFLAKPQSAQRKIMRKSALNNLASLREIYWLWFVLGVLKQVIILIYRLRVKNLKCHIVLISLLFLFVHGCGEESPPPVEQKSPDYEGIIVAVGDSLTEGLGVAEESAYPALLEKKLAAQGYRYQVINAGISGETSSGTLSRITWVLNLKPDIVILIIGGNDGLRGIDPALIKENITRIIKVLKENDIIVLLGGMQIVQNLGRDYATDFGGIYPDVARGEAVIFMPFFLSDVAGVPALNQADGIHPNAEGYRVIVDNTTPYLIEAIKAHKAKSNIDD
jgi:acyl-CoA thioesterase-1